MTVTFYTIHDDPRVVEKTLENALPSRTFNLLDNCSTHNPNLVLSYSSDLIHANYFKIEEWNAYYFMGDPVVSPGGRCVISGTEDVLMTYKDEILSLNAYCSRCESKFERYAIDTAVPSLVTTIVTNLPFSHHYFNANDDQGTGHVRQYLLTVKGGSLSVSNSGNT